jgi:multisubunit Na+/H+ antiporter MnhG subunit
MKRHHTMEWEAIAGLIAAVVAIILHFLHVTDVNVLRVITLALPGYIIHVRENSELIGRLREVERACRMP